MSKWQFPDAVYASTKPKFIVHGEEDELIPLQAVREFYARLQEPKELVVIDRANHLFEGQAGRSRRRPRGTAGGFLMPDAVIVSAARTPVGKAPNGALRTVRPDDMAAAVIAEALRRAPRPRRRPRSTT